MSVTLQLVRGSDATLASYMGSAGEIAISTTDWRPRVFSGALAGGYKVALVSDRKTGTAAPVSGTYAVGDIVWHSAPVAGGFIGFVCVTAGSPGTWKTFGAISA